MSEIVYYRDFVCLAGEDVPFVMQSVFAGLHGLMRQTGQYAVCLPMANKTDFAHRQAPPRLRLVYDRSGAFDAFFAPEAVDEAVTVTSEKTITVRSTTRFVRVSRVRPELSSAWSKLKSNPQIVGQDRQRAYVERQLEREKAKRDSARAHAFLSYCSAFNGRRFKIEWCVFDTTETAFQASGSFGTGVAPLAKVPII